MRILTEKHSSKCLGLHLGTEVKPISGSASAAPPPGCFGRVGVVAARLARGEPARDPVDFGWDAAASRRRVASSLPLGCLVTLEIADDVISGAADSPGLCAQRGDADDHETESPNIHHL